MEFVDNSNFLHYTCNRLQNYNELKKPISKVLHCLIIILKIKFIHTYFLKILKELTYYFFVKKKAE